MTVSESKSGDKLLLWALAISLLIHLAVFGGWKWSQSHPWWRQVRLPAWMELGQNKFVASIAKKLPAVVVKEPQTPMLYIDVDPSLASAQPPQNPKYYSSADTRAANPEIKVPSDVPQISGTQTKVPKTVPPAAKTVPLQPSPPKNENTELAEAKPLPKPSLTAGDLTLAKPGEKMQDAKGTNETDLGKAAQAQPKHERPRTLAEARAEQGIQGDTSRQAGGVPHLALQATEDTARTPYGDYDRDFINAVRSRWYDLLQNRIANPPGKVVLEFDLHPDGRITGMTNPVSEVNLLLETLCESAVLDPAPFKPWPQDMRTLISDPRHLRFTFFYENE
ncbi:MAG: hypothetical protein ABSF38_14460 [Verrucomicrobiota bacterium]|jgi:outer membrane biosynthesis protein TonB